MLAFMGVLLLIANSCKHTYVSCQPYTFLHPLADPTSLYLFLVQGPPPSATSLYTLRPSTTYTPRHKTRCLILVQGSPPSATSLYPLRPSTTYAHRHKTCCVIFAQGSPPSTPSALQQRTLIDTRLVSLFLNQCGEWFSLPA